MNQEVSIQDFAASIVAVALVVGVILLSVLQDPIPSEIATSLGAAITWLFVRSTQQAEQHRADTKDVNPVRSEGA